MLMPSSGSTTSFSASVTSSAETVVSVDRSTSGRSVAFSVMLPPRGRRRRSSRRSLVALVDGLRSCVLECHPGQQCTFYSRGELCHTRKRDTVLEPLLVRFDVAAAVHHGLELIENHHRVVDRLPDEQVVQHRRRGLADRTALRVVRDVLDLRAFEVDTHRDLVSAGGIDVVYLGLVWLPQAFAVRVLVMVEDDLLVKGVQVHVLTRP